jgi:hypothetical protein
VSLIAGGRRPFGFESLVFQKCGSVCGFFMAMASSTHLRDGPSFGKFIGHHLIPRAHVRLLAFGSETKHHSKSRLATSRGTDNLHHRLAVIHHTV